MRNRGKNIKALRKKAGFTPDDAAEKLGINSSWYWDLEAYDDEVTDTINSEPGFYPCRCAEGESERAALRK